MQHLLVRSFSRNLGISQQVRHGTAIPVILLQNIERRGNAGEIISVKRGFMRNLLFPRKLAAYATQENLEKYKALIEKGKQEKVVPEADKASA